MRPIHASLAVLALLGASACAVARPAILPRAGPACMAELKAALKTATGKTVTLREDAFARSSKLELEGRPSRDAQLAPRDGRLLGTPLQAALAMTAQGCVLRAGGQQVPLPSCGCRPAP